VWRLAHSTATFVSLLAVIKQEFGTRLLSRAEPSRMTRSQIGRFALQFRLLLVALFLIAGAVGLGAHVPSCASTADHVVVGSRTVSQASGAVAAERKSPDLGAGLASGTFGGDFAVAVEIADCADVSRAFQREPGLFSLGDSANTALAHRKITVLLI
jgi:hypothetical protein